MIPWSRYAQQKLFLTILSGIFLSLFLLLSTQNLSAEQYWNYEVQRGDSLWKLSKTHLIAIKHWKTIQSLNGIKDPNRLEPGSIIRFPAELLKPNISAGKLTSFTGQVEVQRYLGQQSERAFLEMLLWTNDTLRVGQASSATVMFSDSSKVLIEENSVVVMNELLDFGAENYSKTKIELQSGRLHNNINPRKQSRSRFEISTPSAIAAVRGTEYRVSADKSGESKTEVLTGGVAVSGTGSKLDIDAGYGTITTLQEGPTTPEKLLDPPVIQEVPVTIERVPFPVYLKPLSGAATYRMQISNSEEFDSLLFDTKSATSKLWGPDLPNGRYYLRVRGVDQKGLEGFDTVYPFSMAAHPIPPMIIQPKAGALLKESSPTFEWAQPEEANFYTFQLSDTADFSKLIFSQNNYSENLLSLEMQLSAGRYFWRVASVDKQQHQGPFNGQEFRIVPPSPDMTDARMDENMRVFHWPKSSVAASYRCQIASDPDFSDLIIDKQVTEPAYNLEDIPPGKYFIRIAVIDLDGYEGPFSASQKFAIPQPPSLWNYAIPIIFLLIVLL